MRSSRLFLSICRILTSNRGETNGIRRVDRRIPLTKPYAAARLVKRRAEDNDDAIASTIPFTANSHAVAGARLQSMAIMARAGTIFMPGKLKGGPSARTSRCTKNQQAAQQSRSIRRTAMLESTASFSNVPVVDKAKAIAA